jgi:2-oxoglutarate ferredoxin oxidoreductase subunit gamma
MEQAIVLAGFGGQGLLFAGNVLATAGVIDGREVSWMPSYGPEMRGGTASCTVIIADRPIGSPMADAAVAVIALNPPSLAKYEDLVESGGLLIVNTSLIEAEPSRDDIEIAAVPCTALAVLAGDERLSAVVALGALGARRSVVSMRALREALEEVVGAHHPELLAADLAAFSAGSDAARDLAAAGLAAWDDGTSL